MFRRKLSALDYHNPGGFSCRGEGPRPPRGLRDPLRGLRFSSRGSAPPHATPGPSGQPGPQASRRPGPAQGPLTTPSGPSQALLVRGVPFFAVFSWFFSLKGRCGRRYGEAVCTPGDRLLHGVGSGLVSLSRLI